MFAHSKMADVNQEKSMFLKGILHKSINSNCKTEEVESMYDKWASNYDEDVATHGYVGCEPAAKYLDKYAEELSLSKQTRILDVGCGTGLLGSVLHEAGYVNIDGLDLSEQMLKVAKLKNVYRDFIHSPIGDGNTIDKPDNFYGALACVGSLNIGHIKADGIIEFARLVKKGGIILLTFRMSALECKEHGHNYIETMDNLVAKGVLRLIAKDVAEYHTDVPSLINKDDFKTCRLYTFVVTK